MIAWLTLRPAPQSIGITDLTPWWCLSCGEAGSADLFQNLLLFLPLGLAWRRAGAAAGPTLLVSLALTLTIELTQAFILPGRDAALGDLLANTLGGGAGWALWPVLTGIGRPTPQLASRLAGVALGAFAMQALLSGWLLVPDLRRPGPWAVVATPPRLSDGVTARGKVIDLRIDNIPAADRVPGARGPIEATLRVVWRDGQGIERLPLARLERGEREVLLGFDLADGTLGAGVRQGATTARLRGPQVALPLPDLTEGDTLTAVLRQGGGVISLALTTSRGEQISRTVPLGTAEGWLLINPFSQRVVLPDGWRRWTLAWLAGWGVLLGWGAGAARCPVAWGVLALVVTGAVVWGGDSSWSVADAAALAAGWLVAAAVTRSRRGGVESPSYRGRSAARAASP